MNDRTSLREAFRAKESVAGLALLALGVVGPHGEPPRPDPNIARLEHDLTDKLGARVQLQHGAKGRGKLVIAYNSLDELDGILAHIQ